MSEKKKKQTKKADEKNKTQAEKQEVTKKSVDDKVTNKKEVNNKKTTNKKKIADKKQVNKKESLKISGNKKSFWANANEMTRLIVVFLIVVGVFLVFYVITNFIKSGSSSSTDSDDSVAVIQYDEILVGEILNQNRDMYYVLATLEDDPNLSLYVSYVGSYTASEDASKVYTVDLSSVFNNQFVADESDFDIDEVKDIKFKEATLLKVENEQITEYYEGKDEIVEILKELIG